MQIRRFDGAHDWLAPVAAVDVARPQVRRASAIRRWGLVLVGLLAAFTLALGFTAQAQASSPPACNGELASWSSDPLLELPDASWNSRPHLESVKPKDEGMGVALNRAKKHKFARVVSRPR